MLNLTERYVGSLEIAKKPGNTPDSKYSKIILGENKFISRRSKYDNIKIENIKNLFLRMVYEVNIGELTKSLIIPAAMAHFNRPYPSRFNLLMLKHTLYPGAF